jgi:hypothetical protein
MGPATFRVLVGHECSGLVRDAFIARGHDAWSCDIKPTERPGPHLQKPLAKVLASDDRWDLLIAHPDCTYLCSSGLHWNRRRDGRSADTEAALMYVRWLLGLRIPRIAVENPVGCIGTRIRKADQYIQPYEFGHDASKRTGLWLKGLPKLQPTQYVEPRIVDGKPRWGNQTDSGQNRLSPSESRATERSRTFTGWAEAMADQWGSLAEFSLEATG